MPWAAGAVPRVVMAFRERSESRLESRSHRGLSPGFL